MFQPEAAARQGKQLGSDHARMAFTRVVLPTREPPVMMSSRVERACRSAACWLDASSLPLLFGHQATPLSRFILHSAVGTEQKRREDAKKELGDGKFAGGFGFTCQVKVSDFGQMASIALFSAFASS